MPRGQYDRSLARPRMDHETAVAAPRPSPVPESAFPAAGGEPYLALSLEEWNAARAGTADPRWEAILDALERDEIVRLPCMMSTELGTRMSLHTRAKKRGFRVEIRTLGADLGARRRPETGHQEQTS